jgi:hypothetical protein
MSEEIGVYMTAPTANGTPPLPKRAGTRAMVPTTWIDRSLRVEYAGAGGDTRETKAILLDWSPAGVLLNIAGTKALLLWERLVLRELVEDR